MKPNKYETPHSEVSLHRRSRMAVIAFGLACVGWFIVFLAPVNWYEPVLAIAEYVVTATWAVSLLLGIFTILLMVIRRKSMMRGKGLAIAAICMSLIGICLPVVVSRLYEWRARVMADADKCSENLRSLHKALIMYATDWDGRLPTASKWCDLLVTEVNVPQETFVCPVSEAKIGQSSYALNENVADMHLAEIPPNTVLLFECAPSWNSVGGRGLFIPGHQAMYIRGGTVLLANGEVLKFVSKDFEGFRWLSDANSNGK